MEIKVTSEPQSAPAVSATPPTATADLIQPTTDVVEAPPAPIPNQPVTEPLTPEVPVSASEPAPAGPSPGPAAPPATMFEPQTDGASLPPPPANPTAATLPPKKKSLPLAVIILAVVITLAIGAVVVFAYMKGKDKPTTQTKAPAAPVVTSTDITTASQDIDKDLSKVDDSKDVSSSDLSDQTLGL